MKDLFMFKTTQVLENEEPKEITSLFGFKIIGKQMEMFVKRGPIPHISMIGMALRNSEIIKKYIRKHPYNITYNTGQSGHVYYDLYYFPVMSGNYTVDTTGPVVKLEGVAVKKKAASFEINSTGKIAPEMVSKTFYINDFIDLVLAGLKDFGNEVFDITEIELKEQSMYCANVPEYINAMFNKELDCIFDANVFYFDNIEHAQDFLKDLTQQLLKDFVSVNDVFHMKGVLQTNKKWQPDYERFGWDYNKTQIIRTTPILEKDGLFEITLPEPVQEEEEIIIVEEEK